MAYARAPTTLALLAALACSPDQPLPPVVRSTVGDTTFVHNNSPIHRDTATLRPVMRIGLLDGPDEYLFKNINAFTVDRDGVAYLAEDDGPIRSFDASGRFLATVARLGEGPGEVKYVTGLTTTMDGRLIARDDGNNRLNVYEAAPGSTDHWPLSNTRPTYGRNAIERSELGGVLIGINPRRPMGPAPEIEFPRPVFARLTGDGEPVDTLYVPTRHAEDCPVLGSGQFGRGAVEDPRVPYFPMPKWTVTSDGALLAGCPATYTYDVVRPDGTTLRVSRSWEPVIAAREELEAFVEVLTFEMNRSGLFDEWTFPGPELPRERPAYDRILTAEDGRIWVWPTQPRVRVQLPVEFTREGYPEHFWPEPGTGAFDVFEPDGRWLGTVRIPPDWPYTPYPDTPDPFVRGDTVWAVTVDSLEVNYLTRFEVEWPLRRNAGGSRPNP